MNLSRKILIYLIFISVFIVSILYLIINTSTKKINLNLSNISKKENSIQNKDQNNKLEYNIEILEKEYAKTIIIEFPTTNQIISSPLIIKGRAKGNWFFEATFPVTLVDWDGRIIAESYVTAKDDWMTESFIPFEGKLEFKNPSFPNTDVDHFSHRGTLIFRSANPSGLPEHQYYFELPIRFK